MPDYRVIPSIEQLRQRARVQALEAVHGRRATVDALRSEADAVRVLMQAGETLSEAQAETRIVAAAADRLRQQFSGSLRAVINATGVVVHTNLGRAPLGPGALERVVSVARGYANLEYDLARGVRGSRHGHAEALLTTLTSAEAALVANNNAAAMLLALAALAHGREVVISRGELVEIGGGFRIPDVMAQSGATLREVGTTNRTRLSDYTAAIHGRTAMVLRVHRSNFRIAGFTEQPSLAALAATAHERDLPLVEDLGSGNLVADRAHEPSVAASIAAGADLVCFSGDKMLGGPQAGIVVGRTALVERLRRHPLMRALRVDKLTLAALEGTLLEYVAGRHDDRVPVMRMIRMSASPIASRAQALRERLVKNGWSAEIIAGVSTVGGGSAPGVELPTMLLAVARDGLGPEALEAQLRA
ncbi:MAG: L-seryl-tRNA(Sec) selenium transferase, partial [Vicinamibacterales bacterium]